ncbi:MAG: CoA-binding protein [Candidatus Eiseniibacteriota bacterium]
MDPVREPAEEELARIVRHASTVAVVGMKDDSRPFEPAHAIPRICRDLGMRILPVNPTIESALGVPSVDRLASLSIPFDLVDVFRRSERIPELAEEILALPPDRRPAVVWLQSGIRHDAAAARLEDAGIRVVQDACLGVYAQRYRRRTLSR